MKIYADSQQVPRYKNSLKIKIARVTDGVRSYCYQMLSFYEERAVMLCKIDMQESHCFSSYVHIRDREVGPCRKPRHVNADRRT